MAHLAIVGSCSVNGVAETAHRASEERGAEDFAELWPEKFNNKTNGITPRRWLLKANPPLARLITETIGDGWITDLDQLRKLEPLADDPEFRNDSAKPSGRTRGAGRTDPRETGIAVSRPIPCSTCR